MFIIQSTQYHPRRVVRNALHKASLLLTVSHIPNVRTSGVVSPVCRIIRVFTCIADFSFFFQFPLCPVFHATARVYFPSLLVCNEAV